MHEKARKRVRKRGQPSEDHSVSHLARGLCPIQTVCPPAGSVTPLVVGMLWEAMLGAWAGSSACFTSAGHRGSRHQKRKVGLGVMGSTGSWTQH